METRSRRHVVAHALLGPALLWVLAGGVAGVVSASPFGINAHIPSDAVLDEVHAAGIAWVRMDFRWDLLEPSRDRFDWARYDGVVDAARARGLRIFATLQGTPTWATSGSPGNGVPDDPDDWADFCFRVAQHFAGRVDAWGLWNEPNLPGFWAGTREQYITVILRGGARVIHVADPRALVAGPDLAHLQSADWSGWLLDSVRRAGDVLDVVTHHVYPSGRTHTDVTKKLESGGSNPWDAPAVKSVLEEAGWGGRPFWLTETGMESNVAGEADQAGFYSNLLADWFRPDRDLSWVDRIFFYEMVDDPGAQHPSFGILGAAPNLVRKQAFYAYRDFIAASQVDDAEIVAATMPAFVHPGASADVRVTVRNTGTTAWSSGDGVVLRAYVYGLFMVAAEGELAAGSVVAPGEETTFDMRLDAPVLPTAPQHAYRVDLRMRRSGSWWFGTPGSWTVVVSADEPPVVTGQPVAVHVLRGTMVVETVTASGPGPLRYRWQRNGRDLVDSPRFAGSGTPVLQVLAMDADVAGSFRCIVGNPAGEVASLPAELMVIAPARRGTASATPDPGGQGEGVTPPADRTWPGAAEARPGPPAPGSG